MRKIKFLIAFLLFSLTGCSFQDSDPNQYKIWLISHADNNLRIEFNHFIFEFDRVLELTERAETKEELAYIQGMIDGMLMRVDFPMDQIFSKSNLDQEILNQIVDPPLQDELPKLKSEIRNYLNQLNEDIKNDQSLSKYKEEIPKIRENLNVFHSASNIFTEEESVKNILAAIQQLNKIMEP